MVSRLSSKKTFTSNIVGRSMCLEEKMKYEAFRLETFKNWIFYDNARPIPLAKCGFFSINHNDTVTCFSCGVQKSEWGHRSDPEVVHRELNPSCLHICGQDTTNVPIFVPSEDDSKRLWDELHATYCSEETSSHMGNFSSNVDHVDTTDRSSSPVSVNDYSSNDFNSMSRNDETASNSTDSPITSDSDEGIAMEGAAVATSNNASKSKLALIGFDSNLFRNVTKMSSVQMVSSSTYETQNLAESERLKTFDTWRNSWPIPSDLASCGFIYTGISDRVQCVFCNGILKSWDPSDIPEVEHRKHFPNCPFVQNESVDNILVQSGSPARQGALVQVVAPAREVATAREVAPARGTASSREAASSAPRRLQPSLHINEMGCTIMDPDIINTLGTFPGVNSDTPRHPHYVTEASRVATFTNWPNGMSQTPQQLAKAGFFYAGFDDSVKCFYCDGGLRTWLPDDDPWEEHARWFTRCPYVLQVRGDAFVQQFRQNEVLPTPSLQTVEEREILARMDLPVVQAVLRMDIPREIVKLVIKDRLERIGDDFPDVESMLDAIYHKGDLSSAPPEVMYVPAPSSRRRPDNKKQAPIEFSGRNESARSTSDTESSTDQESLMLENQRLKEQRNCKICMDEEANIVLLPCGHLVSCGTCAPALKNCPICRAIIKGTVRTYLS